MDDGYRVIAWPGAVNIGRGCVPGRWWGQRVGQLKTGGTMRGTPSQAPPRVAVRPSGCARASCKVAVRWKPFSPQEGDWAQMAIGAGSGSG